MDHVACMYVLPPIKTGLDVGQTLATDSPVRSEKYKLE